jgi:hypothetical protein
MEGLLPRVRVVPGASLSSARPAGTRAAVAGAVPSAGLTMAFTTKKAAEASMVHLPTGRLWTTIPVTAPGIERCAGSAPEGPANQL